jgi:deoxyribodipyrimidine photo-lyase
MSVPPLRIRPLNDAPPRPEGEFVLYWMIANRRLAWNFSLDRALEWCRDLQRPLVILEALRVGYRWASDRLHRFVIEGMAANERSLARHAPAGVTYYPYVEPKPGAGAGLVEALAARAAVVVTDDFPAFFLPRMLASVGPRLPVSLEAVDSNGLLPMRAASQVYSRAFDFRRFLQKNLPPHLAEDQFPASEPLRKLSLPAAVSLGEEIARRWPAADVKRLASDSAALAALPIDHDVKPSPIRGGSQAASQTLETFVESRLARYADERSDPDADAASGLSPYLHFGHVSVHEVFARTTATESWSTDRISGHTTGSNKDWWGTSPTLESFLDELVTWRELGYNFCWQRDDYDQYESLPAWAQQTLAKHAADPREHTYSLAEFAAARTHDPLWNAAQRQLVREGRMQNYLRMLWGKKIVEWTASPQEALATMIELNNKYALDGRNPNSYSGIFWVLGRYDRPWAPERPIFGTIRWMSSDNTARKLHVKKYLQQYGPQPTLFPA